MYRDSIPDTAQDDRYAGFRVLWLKVIVRAISDYVTYKDCSKLEKKRYADGASVWMFRPNVCFNGFENVCRMLDIDPNRVRSRARKLSKEEVANLERALDDFDVLQGRGLCCVTSGLLSGRVDDEGD
jgi:hypothetical protein